MVALHIVAGVLYALGLVSFSIRGHDLGDTLLMDDVDIPLRTDSDRSDYGESISYEYSAKSKNGERMKPDLIVKYENSEGARDIVHPELDDDRMKIFPRLLRALSDGMHVGDEGGNVRRHEPKPVNHQSDGAKKPASSGREGTLGHGRQSTHPTHKYNMNFGHPHHPYYGPHRTWQGSPLFGSFYRQPLHGFYQHRPHPHTHHNHNHNHRNYYGHPVEGEQKSSKHPAYTN